MPFPTQLAAQGWTVGSRLRGHSKWQGRSDRTSAIQTLVLEVCSIRHCGMAKAAISIVIIYMFYHFFIYPILYPNNVRFSKFNRTQLSLRISSGMPTTCSPTPGVTQWAAFPAPWKLGVCSTESSRRELMLGTQHSIPTGTAMIFNAVQRFGHASWASISTESRQFLCCLLH